MFIGPEMYFALMFVVPHKIVLNLDFPPTGSHPFYFIFQFSNSVIKILFFGLTFLKSLYFADGLAVVLEQFLELYLEIFDLPIGQA